MILTVALFIFPNDLLLYFFPSGIVIRSVMLSQLLSFFLCFDYSVEFTSDSETNADGLEFTRLLLANCFVKLHVSPISSKRVEFPIQKNVKRCKSIPMSMNDSIGLQ